MIKSVRQLVLMVAAGAAMLVVSGDAFGGIFRHRHHNSCCQSCCTPCNTGCSTCGNQGGCCGGYAMQPSCCGVSLAVAAMPAPPTTGAAPMPLPATPAKPGTTPPVAAAPMPPVAPAPCATCGSPCVASADCCCETHGRRHRFLRR